MCLYMEIMTSGSKNTDENINTIVAKTESNFGSTELFGNHDIKKTPLLHGLLYLKNELLKKKKCV